MGAGEAGTSSRHPAIAALFLATAIVLGGGGTPNPGTEVLLQLAFAVAVLAWLWLPTGNQRLLMPRSMGVWVVSGLVLALPLLQLIPLPPGLWTRFDGQGTRAAALALVGAEQSWQPLSHYPSRTLAALLALLPPLFAFIATSSLDSRGRVWLVAAIAIMGLVTALLGALQLSLGEGALRLYPESHSGVVTGFQANRNAAADVLLISMAAIAAFLVPSLTGRESRSPDRPRRALLGDRRAAGIILVGALVLLFFATVLTRSRTGIALLAVALLAIWVILRPSLSDLGRWRHLPAAVAVLAVLLVAAFAWQGDNSMLAMVADRFAVSEDERTELWRDGWFAMSAAWPFGVGMGGAQPALIAVERLEVLNSRLPNRVHNDYLELALEGGLVAVALLAAVIAILAWNAWRTWRQRPEERHFTWLGVSILGLTALHSFVDYPLRSMALACLVGTGAGLLFAAPRPPAAPDRAADGFRA